MNNSKKISYRIGLDGYIKTPCPYDMREGANSKHIAPVAGYTCMNCPHNQGINVLQKCVFCNHS